MIIFSTAYHLKKIRILLRTCFLYPFINNLDTLLSFLSCPPPQSHNFLLPRVFGHRQKHPKCAVECVCACVCVYEFLC